jgi:hypothetical protein
MGLCALFAEIFQRNQQIVTNEARHSASAARPPARSGPRERSEIAGFRCPGFFGLEDPSSSLLETVAPRAFSVSRDKVNSSPNNGDGTGAEYPEPVECDPLMPSASHAKLFNLRATPVQIAGYPHPANLSIY